MQHIAWLYHVLIQLFSSHDHNNISFGKLHHTNSVTMSCTIKNSEFDHGKKINNKPLCITECTRSPFRCSAGFKIKFRTDQLQAIASRFHSIIYSTPVKCLRHLFIRLYMRQCSFSILYKDTIVMFYE